MKENPVTPNTSFFMKDEIFEEPNDPPPIPTVDINWDQKTDSANNSGSEEELNDTKKKYSKKKCKELEISDTEGLIQGGEKKTEYCNMM